jgi:hypothetical protein
MARGVLPASIRAPGTALAAVATCALLAGGAHAGDPVRLEWREGDVAGFAAIQSADGREMVGTVEFRQTRRGDELHMERVATFRDGSRDEDTVVAVVGEHLRAVRGRSVLRDADGRSIADLTIDVAEGRISGTAGSGADEERFDERVSLPDDTYWGPLIFIVAKNFDANAEGDRIRFTTVAPTPRPRVIGMELVRRDAARIGRAGLAIECRRLTLRPTVNRVLDPMLHLVVPEAAFCVTPTEPPALARFMGPRNFAGQEITIQ